MVEPGRQWVYLTGPPFRKNGIASYLEDPDREDEPDPEWEAYLEQIFKDGGDDMVAKIAGQRATASDVSKVSGASGVGENPPVTGEPGQKAEAKGRHTGRNNMNEKGSGSGHDGVMGKRGGTTT